MFIAQNIKSYCESLVTYATDVPKKENPVVTAPVGVELELEVKPTWVNSPSVGTMYIAIVSLNDVVFD